MLLKGAAGRQRSRLTGERERSISYALKRMASTPREEWSEEMHRFESAWGRELAPEELYNAAQRVRFQLGQRDNFIRGLQRSGQYIEQIIDQFRKEGLPEELAYLPHVESSFNYKAYSKVGAAGIWQFMPSTGKVYMKVGYDVDERLDPIKSTRGAVLFLRGNYETLQSWPLAVTAYNHGRSSMERAVRELGTTDLNQIILNYKTRSFRFASKNFYSEFIAAYRTAKDYTPHFGPLTLQPSISFVEVPLHKHYRPSTLTGLFGVPISVLEEHNMALRPHLFKRDHYLPKGYVLKLPPSFSNKDLMAKLAAATVEEAPEKLPLSTYYTVETGDNLSNIARRFRVPLSTLFELNNLHAGGRIHAGQLLSLPGGAVASIVPPEARASAPISATSSIPTLAIDTVALVPRPAAPLSKLEVGGPPVPTYLLASKPKPGTGYEAVLDSIGRVWENLYPAIAAIRPMVEPPCILCEFSGDFYGLDVLDTNENGVQIRVQVDETVGHLADWAGTVSIEVRSLNQISSEIRLGQRLWVPLSPDRRKLFVNRRIEYHVGIEEDFFNNYVVTSLDSVEIKAGTRAWSLALERDIPLWLLMKANNLDGDLHLTPKMKILIPEVEAKKN